MRYYFAGAYQRRAELAGYAMQLQGAGIGALVVSRWLEMDQPTQAGFGTGDLRSASEIARAWTFAERDLQDIDIAQAVVSFTGEGTRGGRHIEFGVALQQAIGSGWDGVLETIPRLVIVGPREHVFHCHPAVAAFPDFAAFLAHEIDRSMV